MAVGIILLGLAVAVGPAEARRDDTPGPRTWAETLEFAVVGGYAALDVTGANDDIDRDAGWSAGFLIGYNFSDWLGILFEYRSVHSKAITDIPGLPAGDCVTSKCDVATHGFGLSAVYNIGGGRWFVHFAKVGAGGYSTIADDFTGSGGYVGVGIGTRFFPLARSPIHLRAEAEFNGRFPAKAAIQGQDVDAHSSANVRLSLGIGYLFH